MLVCAIDPRPRSIRLVLVANDNGPEVLEGCCLRSTAPGPLLARLRAWQDMYQVSPLSVVCCQSDLVRRDLVEALEEAGYHVDWLRAETVDTVLKSWRYIRLDPRWQRAGLMSWLLVQPLSSFGEPAEMAPWRWLYASLRKQVADLESWVACDTPLLYGVPYDPEEDAKCWPPLDEEDGDL